MIALIFVAKSFADTQATSSSQYYVKSPAPATAISRTGISKNPLIAWKDIEDPTYIIKVQENTVVDF